MLKFLVIIMLAFTAVEAAHLNYHVQSERSERLTGAPPIDFDKNF